MTRRRTWITRVVAAVAAIGAVSALATTSTATATEGYCGISWGSTTKTATQTRFGHLVGVRAGRHDCFDRLVLDIRAGGVDGYHVSYVDEVSYDGSGQVVPLRGGAKLQVIPHAPAYDDAGNDTYTPANRTELVNVAGWTTFRQIAWAGSFEGQSTIGLGVRARLPFRVMVLDGPAGGTRIVVDVAHRWS